MEIRNKILSAVVTAFDLKHTDTMAVDMVGKCPITLTIGKGNSVFVKFPMEKETFKQATTEMYQMIDSRKVTNPQQQGGMVVMRLDNWKCAPEGYECIRKIVRELATPAMGDTTCPYCGQSGCNTAAVKDGVYTQMHERCRMENEEKMHGRLGTGNYFTGLLGALGGSLLVLAVSLFLLAFTNRSFGWLYAISTFAAMGGYIALKGPYGVAGTVTVGVCSLLSFVVFQYGYAILILSEMGIHMDMSRFGSEFMELTKIVFSVEYITESWFEILFFVGGFVVTLVGRPLSKEKRKAEIDAQAALAAPLTGDILGR